MTRTLINIAIFLFAFLAYSSCRPTLSTLNATRADPKNDQQFILIDRFIDERGAKRSKRFISTPRLYPGFGIPQSPESRLHSFAAAGKMNKKTVGWRVLKYSRRPELVGREDMVQAVLMMAFNAWQMESGFRFENRQSSNEPADILISFDVLNHGDPDYFDGEGGVLAHVLKTNRGVEIHFDDAERWSMYGEVGGPSIMATALHEIGHVLGLGHSRDPNAAMYAAYTGKQMLTTPDIRALRELYKPQQYNWLDNGNFPQFSF